MTYITKTTTNEELIEECRRLKKELFYAKQKNTEDVAKRSKIRKDWNVKYNKLKYQLMKKDQLIYGKELHISRLQKRTKIIANRYKRDGYREAMNRFRSNNYKVIGLARFLFNTDTVMQIYNLDFREYSFILWAGRYDFFTKKDFDQIPNNGSISFYSLINRLVKRNLVNYIAKEQGSAAKILALTGTGVDIYNKISKFTNKFLSEGETKT